MYTNVIYTKLFIKHLYFTQLNLQPIITSPHRHITSEHSFMWVNLKCEFQVPLEGNSEVDRL